VRQNPNGSAVKKYGKTKWVAQGKKNVSGNKQAQTGVKTRAQRKNIGGKGLVKGPFYRDLSRASDLVVYL